jgi:hypothetical protein
MLRLLDAKYRAPRQIPRLSVTFEVRIDPASTSLGSQPDCISSERHDVRRTADWISRAPTARNAIAQANSLGREVKSFSASTARNKFPTSHREMENGLYLSGLQRSVSNRTFTRAVGLGCYISCL